MKIFKCLMVCISVAVAAGCAGRFRGPAGEHFHVHFSQGLALFKIKSPDQEWYTNKNINAGHNEALNFDNVTPKSENKFKFSEELTADFEFGKFLNDSEYFVKKLSILLSESESESENLLLMSQDSRPGKYSRVKKLFKGKTCFVLDYEEPEIIRTTELNNDNLNGNVGKNQSVNIKSMAEVGRVIECPGFFRNTFGVLQITMRVSADSLDHAKSIFFKREVDFSKSVDSFEFLSPFSQKIPSGFSLDDQLKKASGKWYIL